MRSWTPPTLNTPRLHLRALREDDAAGLFAYASDPEVARYVTWTAHRGQDESLAFIRNYAFANYARRVPDPFALVLRDEPGRLVGTAGCFWASEPHRTLELGYALARPYWGRGLAAEAAATVLDYVFAAYPVERVQARCFRQNGASLRVMEKLGMVREGTLRAAVQKDGRMHDCEMCSLLRPEWLERRRTRLPAGA
jgi:ribosomal-protein-alanine N-acetyltransferase